MRLRLGTISAFVAALAVLAAILLASATGGAATSTPSTARPGTAAATPSAAANQAVARTKARGALADIRLPPGATRVRRNPAKGSWLDSPATGLSGLSNRIDRRRFYRVTGAPEAAIAWMRQHPPRGASQTTTSTSSKNGTPVSWSVSFGFRHRVNGSVSEVDLGVAVSAAKRGGTALRADGEAVWITPRPVTERVPAGTASVQVLVSYPGARSRLIATVTAPDTIGKLVAYTDSLALQQPGLGFSCPMIGPHTRELALRFLPASATASTTPLATVTENGCGALTFTVAGAPQPALAERPTLSDLLRSLHITQS